MLLVQPLFPPACYGSPVVLPRGGRWTSGRRWAPAIGLLATALSLTVLDVDLSVPEGAGARVASMLAGVGAPDLGADALRRVAWLGLQTLAVAIVGTGLGAAMGLLAAVLGSSTAMTPGRAGRTATEALRLGLDGLRALPDFAWALALLLVMGPGPLTGALAIAISVTGILGRAFGQLLETVPEATVRAVERTGAPPLVAILYGRLPRIAPAAWSYGLARLECSIRNASVIGIVGGGGLGAELLEELGYGRMERMATALLGLVVLTAIADAGSAVLRRKVASSSLHDRRVALRLALGMVLAAAAVLGPDVLELSETLTRLDPRVASQTLTRLLQPDLSRTTLGEAARGALSPLALAWLSTALAATVALALLPWTSTIVRRRAAGPAASARPLAVCRSLALRGAALLARAVPDVVWLLLLAAAVGMGTLPALLALTLHATGVLVRLFTEAVDDAFATTPRAGVGAGAGAGWLLFAALPRLRGHLVTHGALQAEANLRAAFTLGILGAGGLGEAFHGAISYWQLERASTLAIAMLVLFVGLDRLGRWIGRG